MRQTLQQLAEVAVAEKVEVKKAAAQTLLPGQQQLVLQLVAVAVAVAAAAAAAAAGGAQGSS